MLVFSNNQSLELIDWKDVVTINYKTSDDMAIVIFVAVSLVSVATIATLALVKIFQSKMTFVNSLIITDCIISLGHIPIILQIIL